MSTDPAAHTAVVFVHGLLERRPMDTFDSFARTVLAPDVEYRAEPLEVTGSYEARRYVAPSAGTELFEYDWSFLMTGPRYSGEHDAEGDVAFHLREVLALADRAGLEPSRTAPPPDLAIVDRVVHRSWQRSM